MKVWRHSTCMQQTTGYQHMSCSSCTTYEGGWSPSELSLSQEHLVLDRRPINIHISTIQYTGNTPDSTDISCGTITFIK